MKLLFSLFFVLISYFCFGELHDHLCPLNDKTKMMTIRNVNYMNVINLDRLESRENWDVFFTFRDYRDPGAQYYTPNGTCYRPNIETRCHGKFHINRAISSELRHIGPRFATQSMIWTKRGLAKVLRYYEKYKIFMPYNLDIALIPDIRIYSVMEDVVTNKIDAQSDLGSYEVI